MMPGKKTMEKSNQQVKRPRKMKPLNMPLMIGTVILVMILFVMLFPQWLTDKSPYTVQQLRFLSQDGKFAMEKAPFVPSAEFIFGTDDLGRDIWSYIIYGTRMTIGLGILTALSQFLIALPMALLGGTGHRGVKSLIYHTNLFFCAIPALLLSILVLQIDFFGSLNRMQSLLVFVCVLTLVGWPKLGMLLTERVERLNSQAFILGEVAIGKKKWRIALENLVPHLVPEVVVLFFMEVARNLSMMMQLGLFGVFIGNLRLVLDSQNGVMTYFNISYEPEWASMLSTSRTYLTIAPWTVIFPALAFFISVLGFNLFGEGLRNRLQLKNSILIPTVREFLILDYKGLFRRLKPYKRRLFVGALSVVALAVLTFANQPRYDFFIPEGSDFPASQVMIGTEAANESAGAISNAMAELGLEPVSGENYTMTYDMGQVSQLVEQHMTLGETELEPNVDFGYISVGEVKASGDASSDVSGQVVDATDMDLISMTDFNVFENSFVLLDSAYYNDGFIGFWISKISQVVHVKGVLLLAREGESLASPITEKAVNGGNAQGDGGATPVIRVSRGVGELLRQEPGLVLSTRATTKALGGQGRNVVGLFRGSEQALQDEVIAIGLSYNYLDQKGKETLAFNIALMKHLCSLNNNRRSLMFIFMDGTLTDAYHGIYEFSKDVPVSPQKVKVYLDLTGLNTGIATSSGKSMQATEDMLAFSTRQSPATRQFAWSLGQMLSDAFKREGITTRGIESTKAGAEYWFIEKNAYNAMFWEAGIASLIIGGETQDLEALGSILLEVIGKNNY